MKAYRALKPLDAGGRGVVPRGEATPLHWLNDEQIRKLEEVGAVSEIHAPPLSELPLSRTALTKMKKAKVDDAIWVLMATDAELAKKLKVREGTAGLWKSEVARLLRVEPPHRG